MSHALPLQSTAPFQTLRDAYAQARRGTPPLRQRDVAAQLGCSEGEIVAAHVGGPEDAALSTLRLQPRWCTMRLCWRLLRARWLPLRHARRI